MSITEMEAKARELQELKRMREELEAAIAATEDAIKATMGDREQITAGVYKITWKPVISSHLDSTALKRELPEIAARLLKSSTVRRFCIV